MTDSEKAFSPVQRELTFVAVVNTITTTNVVDLTIPRRHLENKSETKAS